MRKLFTLLALAGIFAFAAHAATVTLSTGAQCTYSSLVVGAAGDVSATCASSTTPLPPPPVLPPPPPPAPLGCATHATYTTNFTYSGQKFVFALAPGETAAIAFTPRAGTLPQVSTTETVMTPANADHEVTVSKCPGDFTPIAPCKFAANYVGLSMQLTTGTPTGMQVFYQCPVQAGTTYFMNIRQVVKGAPYFNSCTQGSCEVRAQIQGYQ